MLVDGTHVAVGDPIGALHLWGQHMPVLERRSPSLAWGAAFRGRIDRSLAELARYLGEHPELRAVKAIRADAAFASEFGRERLKTLAVHTPFELASQRSSGLHGMRGVLDNCLFAALTWAFNPEIAARQRFLRPRQELWISRRALEARYGADAPRRWERRRRT